MPHTGDGPALRLHWECKYNGTRAPQGPKGAKGQEQPPASPGASGASSYRRHDGSYDYAKCIRQANWADITASVSVPQLLMVLHQAQIDYLNKDIRQARERLEWIGSATAPDGAHARGAGSMIVGEPAAPSGNAIDESGALYQRVQALLGQLEAGLDYFGFAPDYVPLVSLSEFQRSVETLFKNASNIEIAAQQYWAAQRESESRTIALATAIEATRATRHALEQTQDQLIASVDAMRKGIADLLILQTEKQQALTQAGDDFRNAVEQKAAHQTGGNCQFLQILQALATVATVSAAAWTSVTSIVSQAKSLGDLKVDLSGVSRIAKVVQAVEPDVKKLGEAYQKVQGIVQGSPQSEKQDAAKLLVVKEDFEEMIKPYLDLPETLQYRALVRSYLELIETRNAKILDVEALLLQAENLRAEIARQDFEAVRLSDELARTRDPSTSESAGFMRRAAEQARLHLVSALYMEHKAFEYWALKAEDFKVVDQSVAHLRATHERLLEAVTTTKQIQNRSPQAFESRPAVTLTKETHPEVLKGLQTEYRALFTIPVNHRAFRGRAEITVAKVNIKVRGAKTQDNLLFVKLIHNGRADFLTRSGRLISFTHAPRSTFTQFSLETDAIFAEGDLQGVDEKAYAYLSPFAPWTIEISPDENEGLDLSAITGIEMTFAGFAVARE